MERRSVKRPRGGNEEAVHRDGYFFDTEKTQKTQRTSQPEREREEKAKMERGEHTQNKKGCGSPRTLPICGRDVSTRVARW